MKSFGLTGFFLFTEGEMAISVDWPYFLYKPEPPVINVSPTAKVEVHQQQQEVDKLAAEVKETGREFTTFSRTNKELIEQRNKAASSYPEVNKIGGYLKCAADEIVKLRAQVQDLNAGREKLTREVDSVRGLSAELAATKAKLATAEAFSEENRRRAEACKSVAEGRGRTYPGSDSPFSATFLYPTGSSSCVETVVNLRDKYDRLAAKQAKIDAAVRG